MNNSPIPEVENFCSFANNSPLFKSVRRKITPELLIDLGFKKTNFKQSDLLDLRREYYEKFKDDEDKDLSRLELAGRNLLLTRIYGKSEIPQNSDIQSFSTILLLLPAIESWVIETRSNFNIDPTKNIEKLVNDTQKDFLDELIYYLCNDDIKNIDLEKYAQLEQYVFTEFVKKNNGLKKEINDYIVNKLNYPSILCVILQNYILFGKSDFWIKNLINDTKPRYYPVTDASYYQYMGERYQDKFYFEPHIIIRIDADTKMSELKKMLPDIDTLRKRIPQQSLFGAKIENLISRAQYYFLYENGFSFKQINNILESCNMRTYDESKISREIRALKEAFNLS